MTVTIKMAENTLTRGIKHPLVKTLAIAAGWGLLGQAIKELTVLHDHPWARLATEVAINIRLVLVTSPYIKEVIETLGAAKGGDHAE